MRRISIGVFILIAMPIRSAAQFSSQSCEAPQSTREILAKLRVPEDPRKPAAVRKALELEQVRKGVEGAPEDVFLHEDYQDLKIGRIGDQREAVIEEYEKLLAKYPHSAAFLYLAARAEYSLNTKRAIEELEQALILAPKFGLPHLLLAQIYSASAFSDPAKVAWHLDRFSDLCPSSVRIFPDLRWSKDRGLISRTVTRVRKALDGRTDAEVEATYPILWTLEAALERFDNQPENLKRILKDVELLQGKQFARNTAWLSAFETAADMCDRPALAREAQNEFALLFPNSASALWLAISKQSDENPYPGNNPTTEQIQTYWRREREIEFHLKARLASSSHTGDAHLVSTRCEPRTFALSNITALRLGSPPAQESLPGCAIERSGAPSRGAPAPQIAKCGGPRQTRSTCRATGTRFRLVRLVFLPSTSRLSSAASGQQ